MRNVGITACLLLAVYSCSARAEVALPMDLSGDWQIVNEVDPKASQGCDKMQRFIVSAGGQSITFSEPWADFVAKYKVIRIEKDRMLTIVEGENRMFMPGDPVLWWFNFQDRDTFTFRYYGMPADQKPQAYWKRCK